MLVSIIIIILCRPFFTVLFTATKTTPHIHTFSVWAEH